MACRLSFGERSVVLSDALLRGEEVLLEARELPRGSAGADVAVDTRLARAWPRRARRRAARCRPARGRLARRWPWTTSSRPGRPPPPSARAVPGVGPVARPARHRAGGPVVERRWHNGSPGSRRPCASVGTACPPGPGRRHARRGRGPSRWGNWLRRARARSGVGRSGLGLPRPSTSPCRPAGTGARRCSLSDSPAALYPLDIWNSIACSATVHDDRLGEHEERGILCPSIRACARARRTWQDRLANSSLPPKAAQHRSSATHHRREAGRNPHEERITDPHVHRSFTTLKSVPDRSTTATGVVLVRANNEPPLAQVPPVGQVGQRVRPYAVRAELLREGPQLGRRVPRRRATARRGGKPRECAPAKQAGRGDSRSSDTARAASPPGWVPRSRGPLIGFGGSVSA